MAGRVFRPGDDRKALSFRNLVPTEHLDELLVRLQDLLFVQGRTPHDMILFLCRPEGVASKGTKVIGLMAECQKRHISVTLPLTKVESGKLWFFGSWDAKGKIVILHKILGHAAGAASLQYFLGGHKVVSCFVTGLKISSRLQGMLGRHHRWSGHHSLDAETIEGSWWRITWPGIWIGHILKMGCAPVLEIRIDHPLEAEDDAGADGKPGWE
jgi:hypothetical protein